MYHHLYQRTLSSSKQRVFTELIRSPSEVRSLQSTVENIAHIPCVMVGCWLMKNLWCFNPFVDCYENISKTRPKTALFFPTFQHQPVYSSGTVLQKYSQRTLHLRMVYTITYGYVQIWFVDRRMKYTNHWKRQSESFLHTLHNLSGKILIMIYTSRVLLYKKTRCHLSVVIYKTFKECVKPAMKLVFI